MIWLVIVFKSKLISRLISWNEEIVLAISLAISYIYKSIEFDLNKRWIRLLDLQSWMISQALFSWKFKFSNAALVDSKPLASTTFLAFNEPRRLLSLKILLENSWKLLLFSITSLVSLKKFHIKKKKKKGPTRNPTWDPKNRPNYRPDFSGWVKF